MKLDHLNAELLEKVCNQLWTLQGSLKGLAALLRREQGDSCFEADELFGLGQLLHVLAREVSRVEDVLNCGRDSLAAVELKKGDRQNNI